MDPLGFRITLSFVQILIQIYMIHLVIPIFKIPSPPKFKVESMSTTSPFTLQANNSLSLGFNITFWIGNPNHGSLKPEANVSVYYQKELLVSSPLIESFCPKHETCDGPKPVLSSYVPVTINEPSVPIYDNLTAFSLASDIVAGEVTLMIEVTAHYKPRWIKKATPELNVTCNNIKIGVPDGELLGTSRPLCKIYWDITTLKVELLTDFFVFVLLNTFIFLRWWICPDYFSCEFFGVLLIFCFIYLLVY